MGSTERLLISYVAQNEYDNVVKLLNKVGNNPNFNINYRFTWFGSTALQTAVKIGNTDMCKLLVANGANLKAITFLKSNNLLHLAAREGHDDVCDFLVDNGLNPNDRNGDGKTPLVLAASGAKYAACQYLLSEANANPNLLDAELRSALDYANRTDNPLLKSLIIGKNGREGRSKPFSEIIAMSGRYGGMGL